MIFSSFGAGVQSSCMLMLGIRGEIERPEHVIWADTGFELSAVYKHVDWAEKECRKAGIPFHRVSADMTMKEEFEKFESGGKKYWDSRPPLFTKLKGQTNRQCTRAAKINPIHRKQRELLGYRPGQRIENGAAVMQIGISTDEARRATLSTTAWIDRSYPLIDPMKWTRNDCRAWWNREYSHVALPSSSCTICPYRSVSGWVDMSENNPEDFAEAIDYDERIRNSYDKQTDQMFFLSKYSVPLKELLEEQGKQMGFDLEDDIYCAGGCGL